VISAWGLRFRAICMPRLSATKIIVQGLLWLWTLVCVFPLYWMLVTSLKREDDIAEGPHFLPFIDFTPTLDAWAFILADPNENLLMRFVNSAVISVAATALTLLLAAMAAYGLTRWRRARDGVITAGLFATRILPPIVLVLPVYMMAQWAGLRDTWAALIVAYTAVNLPVALWLLRPVLGARASEQEEAALLDGASHLRVFFDVLLPMMARGLAAVGLLIFILCWNEYLFAAFLASDHAMTVPTWLEGQMSIKEAQVGSEAEEWAHFSAATMLMVMPIIAVSGLVHRALGRAAVRGR
jgi:multiple sugar transport system permease protein